ncbi:hypothetical protein CJ030_MR3G002738 [Morella rubra]|uniref:Uncharacterized protein n=1 Tax=Morella rubra TaxID=262757 RepID=A0A6A1VXC4_9ROSI|nr:hypothetical protein CJ030_MR3G002738 [Morella rubra]
MLSLPSSSSARLFHLPLNLAATEPALDLALAGDQVVVAYPLEKVSDQHVLPCDMDPRKTEVGFPAAPGLARKYGPMILSKLPKRTTTPPSGPSKRSNSVNN